MTSASAVYMELDQPRVSAVSAVSAERVAALDDIALEGEPSCPVTRKPCDRGPTCGVLRPCERRQADKNSPHG